VEVVVEDTVVSLLRDHLTPCLVRGPHSVIYRSYPSLTRFTEPQRWDLSSTQSRERCSVLLLCLLEFLTSTHPSICKTRLKSVSLHAQDIIYEHSLKTSCTRFA
jgi:hypothetical protein